MAMGDVYRLTRRVLINGQAHHNVLHFIQTDPTIPDEDAETNLLFSWIGNPALPTSVEPENQLKDIQRGYSTVSAQGITVQRVLPTLGFPFLDTNTGAWPTAVDNGLPTFAQVKILFQSDLPGRSGRGGMYIGGIPELWSQANLIGASTQTVVSNFIQALIDVYTADGVRFAGYVIGVLSRLLLEFHIIESIGNSTELGTMVSRRQGRGL